MRIAIASEGKSTSSEVCPTAGRAPYYLIFENKELIKTIKNPFVKGRGGAGNSVVQMLYNENVNLVISGKFGGNMTVAMEEKEMSYKIIINQNVDETVELL
jgi:predicted Fe-Mo cluster-binding NifX family protein